MTVIIDASVLSAFVLKEEGWEKIGKLLVNGTSATELVIAETCNSMLTAVRRSRITDGEAESAIDILETFTNANVKILPQQEFVKDAFKLAKEKGLAMYDAIYIVLAKKMGASLASRDPKQIEVAKSEGVRITSV